MRQIIQVPEVIEIEMVRISVPVHHGNEAMPYDFPFRTGDEFEIEVYIDSGLIHGWPPLEAKIDMKVCDSGSYWLFNDRGETVTVLENEYVPSGLIPDGGDYLVLDIGADGIIKNWPKRPNLDKFFQRD